MQVWATDLWVSAPDNAERIADHELSDRVFPIIVNAGVLREIDELPREWPSDFSAFHTVDWWRHHWMLPGCVDVERADDLEGGRDLWVRWPLFPIADRQERDQWDGNWKHSDHKGRPQPEQGALQRRCPDGR